MKMPNVIQRTIIAPVVAYVVQGRKEAMAGVGEAAALVAKFDHAQSDGKDSLQRDAIHHAPQTSRTAGPTLQQPKAAPGHGNGVNAMGKQGGTSRTARDTLKSDSDSDA